MPIIDEHGRPEPPFTAGEVESLIAFLDWQRSTLEWKTCNLDAKGMAATMASSAMTLGGILKHMAWVEDHWFSYVLHDRERDTRWRDVDFSVQPNWEWDTAGADAPETLRSLWRELCDTSRRNVDAFLVLHSIDGAALRSWDRGERPTLRWIMLHMIEEYARHNGHADLLREAVDGLVGE